MSVATEISRLQSDRNTIRNKLIELGLAVSTDNMDKLAAIIENIINRGAVSVTVKEGETYTIPAGFHNGSGTVSGVSGGGNYALQSKTATPTKKQQNITPDNGYYGLSDVTIAAIPEAYQDVSTVSASAGDVLTGKVFVAADGTVVTGTMPNNGTVNKTLSVTTIEFTIPKGYHSGTGKVSIVLETKTVTPTKAAQTVTPSSGEVLSEVTVEPIPDEYQDVTPVTAESADVLMGKTIVDAEGNVVVGNIPVYKGMVQSMTQSSDLGVFSEDPHTNTFDILDGYHENSTVEFESKGLRVTPTKTTQRHNYSSWYHDVVVNAIPDEYQDVTPVTAGAADVLEGQVIVDATGAEIEGTMPDNGTIAETIDGLTVTSFVIPAGKHSGIGTVSLSGDIEAALAAI